METWDAFERAARLTQGTPLAEAIDVADAAAWAALDRAVRDLATGRPSLLPALAWARGRGRRVHWEWDAPLPSVNWRRAEPREPELAVALCHPDGRIRQAALARAAGASALLPLVVIRCADWVAPVREDARELLRQALPGVGPDAIAVLAAVVLRVARRERGGEARDMLEAALRTGPVPVLQAVLASEDRAVRRLAYRIAVERRLFSPVRLAALAAAEGDVVVQGICADAALKAVDADTGDEVLRPLLESRHSRVRSAGVTALHRTGRHAWAEAFLADRSSMVRACARWALRQIGADPAPLCRALCSGEGAAMPSAAPLALAECGSRDDADLLWGLTGHPHDGVRAHAVAALRLLETVDVARLATLLDDPAPRVVREAATTLVPWAGRLSVEELAGRLDPERPRHVRVGAYRLLAARGGAVHRDAALRLSGDPDPGLRANALAVLGSRR